MKSGTKKYGKSLETKVYLLNKVENIVEKGEIAHYEHAISTFVTMIFKSCPLQRHQKVSVYGKGLR